LELVSPPSSEAGFEQALNMIPHASTHTGITLKKRFIVSP
jgi:hypothetical protein